MDPLNQSSELNKQADCPILTPECEPNNSLFGGVFYINLERRQDRRTQIETELTDYGVTYERFNAVDKKPGIVGCGMSHRAVLQEAKKRGYKNVLIFEDDFRFVVSKEKFWTSVNEFFNRNIDFDVLMFAYNNESHVPFDDLVIKGTSVSTTSAYVVNSAFYDTLIDNHNTNIPLLESTNKHWLYALDQAWKTLQPANRFYLFTERLGKQRASYSDNTERFQEEYC